MRDIFKGTTTTEERERIAHDYYTEHGDRLPLDEVRYEKEAKVHAAALDGVELPAYSGIDHEAQLIFFGDIIYNWNRDSEGKLTLKRFS